MRKNRPLFRYRTLTGGPYRYWGLGWICANVAFVVFVSMFFQQLQPVIEPLLPVLKNLSVIFVNMPSELRIVDARRAILLQEIIPLLFINGIIFFIACWFFLFDSVLNRFLVEQLNPNQLEKDEEFQERIDSMRSIRSRQLFNFTKEPVLTKQTRQAKFTKYNLGFLLIILILWMFLYGLSFNPKSHALYEIFSDPRHDLFLLCNAVLVIFMFDTLFNLIVMRISVRVYRQRAAAKSKRITAL